MNSNLTSLFKNKFPILTEIGLDFFTILYPKDFVVLSKKNNIVSINSLVYSSNVRFIFKMLNKTMPSFLEQKLPFLDSVLLNIQSLQTNQIKFYFYYNSFYDEFNLENFLNEFPFNNTINDPEIKDLGIIGFVCDQNEVLEYKYYYGKEYSSYGYRFNKDKNLIDSTKENVVAETTLGDYLDVLNPTTVRKVCISRENTNDEYVLIKNIRS